MIDLGDLGWRFAYGVLVGSGFTVIGAVLLWYRQVR